MRGGVLREATCAALIALSRGAAHLRLRIGPSRWRRDLSSALRLLSRRNGPRRRPRWPAYATASGQLRGTRVLVGAHAGTGRPSDPARHSGNADARIRGHPHQRTAGEPREVPRDVSNPGRFAEPMTSAAPEPRVSPPPTVPSGLESLTPSYFALVMAPGIVSTASHLLGLPAVGFALLALNVVFYVTLWALYLARVVRYRAAVIRDLTDHARAVGFFTIVAGTCVLGAQFVLVVHVPIVATGLWIIATILYVVLLYSVFVALTVRLGKPQFEHAINGTWLVAVVATQGVALLGGNLWNQFPGFEREMLFFSLALWLGDGMLYGWLISLIFYRSLFFEFSPADLS